ncbi:MAG TPA: glucoamylase family protein [Nocardioides sp.]|uniref:glucoamylase family protein n=1 Tax=uncultured Nocardioides sp. TaxID=198441 RepID=UPI0026165B2A|nr:glucoamylase family protein [uncultured Nocardioides sp.]HRI96520.1 glucoamylase family protein [Nocardioides sp.]HRK46012.1 glucoamylase family protein [Nocardioides sp.]
MRPRTLLVTLIATVIATLLGTTTLVVTTTTATSAPAVTPSPKAKAGGTPQLLRGYLKDTWSSFEAMVDPGTGLPADNIGGDLAPSSRSGYTSPTNIGAYLWATVVARDTGLITAKDAHRRMAQTIDTVAGLERHAQSGQFFNWYDPATGATLTTWPENGNPVYPFASSVDNGWLATGLLVAARADRKVAAAADAIREGMDFGFYYNAAEGVRKDPADTTTPVGGQIRGGFWVEPPADGTCNTPGNYRGGAEVYYTCHHYGAFNTEPRMASYLGIAAGQIPQRHYFGTERTFPPTCDWSWTETKPSGEWRNYLGVDVFEGTLPYRGMRVVPTWGGSMFEALMVPLFVPEETWGKRSWGVNHPLYVRGQIEHGLDEAGYGYWGFSPSNNPAGGYREYGVDALGMDGAGYTSDQERTDWDQPYDGCPDRAGEPAPTTYGEGVVTPHASFLALRYAPRKALANLAALKRDFDAYGPGGFYDAVAVGSGTVSKKYLALDQGMIIAALGNALSDDDLRRYVSRGAMERKLRPLMAMEEFGSAAR